MGKYEWLPELVCLHQYDGSWDKYEEVIYSIFKDDFILNKVKYNYQDIAINMNKSYKGKESTFWHIISSGPDEYSRLPDLRRCERIRWPRPIIEHHDNQEIKCWENQRNSQKRIVLWFKEQDYVVILAKVREYYLLVTAFIITYSSQRKKFEKEYINSVI